MPDQDDNTPDKPEEGEEQAETSPPDDDASTTPLGIPPGKIEDLLIEDELKESYLTYAMSVLVARALPDVRDGLKPSQRRLLFTMDRLGLNPAAKSRKCALIVGECMGKYHPHGEQSIYPTLVRMAQDFNMRVLLVQGKGNFGNIDGYPAAAMRYTEARMAPATADILEDIDRDTVEFIPNYDETTTEPAVLPSKFPNLLCNGAQGIAVGMATSIPPHNVGEVCDAIVHLIENPDCTIHDLIQFIQGPDFPTGGLICGRQGIVSAYMTGKGQLTIRARVAFEEERDRVRIVVTEIPYQVQKERLRVKLVEAVKAERVKGISNIQDESSKEGIRLVIDLKRGESPDVVLNQLYKFSPLQTTFSVINISLVNGRPRTLNLKQVLEAYRDHRKEVIRRRTRFLLVKAQDRAHILEGLLIAVNHINDIIAIIRAAENTEAARKALMEKFELTVKQTNAILEMRLRQLTGLERQQLKDEYDKVQESIREYLAILADEGMVLDIIKEDLYELKEKYADPRRTEIVASAEEISLEDLVAEEVMAVTVSHQGYLKREPLSSYRIQGRGGKGLIGQRGKEDDFPEHLFIASTHDYILFFTDDGRVYWTKVYELPQLGRMAAGRHILNVLALTREQRVVSIVPVRKFDDDASVFLVTRHGYMKKVPLSEYSNPRRGGISTIGLEEGDKVLDAQFVRRGQEVVIATKLGMAVRIDESVVRDMGRSARGVHGPRLGQGDEIVALVVGGPSDSLLTVCEKGVGKRSDFADYRKVSSQRSKGVINTKIGDKNGPVVACLAVTEEDEIMLISAKGMVIRSPVTEMREMGRGAVGVYVMNLEEGDKVVSVAKVAREASLQSQAKAEAEKKEQAEKEQATQVPDPAAADAAQPEAAPAKPAEAPPPAAKQPECPSESDEKKGEPPAGDGKPKSE